MTGVHSSLIEVVKAQTMLYVHVRVARGGAAAAACGSVESGVSSGLREPGGRTRSGRCRARSFCVTSWGRARGVASERITMVRKASGTVQMAGSPKRTAGQPIFPTPAIVTMTATDDVLPPRMSPPIAPIQVRRRHLRGGGGGGGDRTWRPR
jgi:hypothetical protein